MPRGGRRPSPAANTNAAFLGPLACVSPAFHRRHHVVAICSPSLSPESTFDEKGVAPRAHARCPEPATRSLPAALDPDVNE